MKLHTDESYYVTYLSTTLSSPQLLSCWNHSRARAPFAGLCRRPPFTALRLATGKLGLMRGSVVKQNDRWYVVIEDRDPATGARKRRWHSGFRTKREPQAACNELAAAMQRGDYLQANRQDSRRVRDGVVGDDRSDGSAVDARQSISATCAPTWCAISGSCSSPSWMDRR